MAAYTVPSADLGSVPSTDCACGWGGVRLLCTHKVDGVQRKLRLEREAVAKAQASKL